LVFASQIKCLTIFRRQLGKLSSADRELGHSGYLASVAISLLVATCNASLWARVMNREECCRWGRGRCCGDFYADMGIGPAKTLQEPFDDSISSFASAAHK
jgi:hypothetical protein